MPSNVMLNSRNTVLEDRTALSIMLAAVVLVRSTSVLATPQMRSVLFVLSLMCVIGCDGVLQIQGYVVDKSGNGISDASVVLTDPRKENSGFLTVEKHTDAIGEFRFVTTCAPGAQKNAYELTITRAGFATVTIATTSNAREYIVLEEVVTQQSPDGQLVNEDERRSHQE